MLSSLYIHFPYCESKCHYCDFFSLPEGRFAENERSRVYWAIRTELEARAAGISEGIDTVFLGGGTPSLVPAAVLESIVTRLPLRASAEVTLEANPSSVDAARARAWRAMGIDRISLGAQSLNDERLRWLGRVHSKNGVFAAFEAVFDAGFRRVSADYIVGVPGQSCRDIEAELGDLLERFPKLEHLSAYLLTLAAGNPKSRELPGEDEQLRQLQTVSNALADRGFEQYEISNFARPGARARHNLNYWEGGGYLGVGPSAHSYYPMEGIRRKNWGSLAKYCELVGAGNEPVEWEERLTPEQRRLEYVMLRLRTSAGLDLAEYRRAFGRDLLQDNRARLEDLRQRGLCEIGERLRLTRDGFFLSDQILSNIN